MQCGPIQTPYSYLAHAPSPSLLSINAPNILPACIPLPLPPFPLRPLSLPPFMVFSGFLTSTDTLD